MGGNPGFPPYPLPSRTPTPTTPTMPVSKKLNAFYQLFRMMISDMDHRSKSTPLSEDVWWCQYCDRDPMGQSCYNVVIDGYRYCTEHRNQCSFMFCSNECQFDEEACEAHRCHEPWCHNRCVIGGRKCQFHTAKRKKS